jgi:murein DD-endopeptidase MepM/ murein hydrolase activator NlpD
VRGSGEAELAKLVREVSTQAQSIRLRAQGRKKVLFLGGRALAVLLLSLAVLVALPPLAWPIRGRVSSAFFFRHKPDSPLPLAIEFHRGLDIAAAAGTRVHASAPGLVIETGSSPDLGNYVRMRHLLGLTSLYAHLSRIDVAKGRLILFRGLPSLGAVGSTGRSTGPHLHFALESGGTRLPPRMLLVFHSLRRSIIGF